ncbi:hypothetical protein O181_090062 [Austropuccinia psidii MF-1]|uniref:Uncharacterized protein n=1 Tax=Austropuccinia psidii MF-1 TaxID=1389203 RepID=A0A9Q3IUM5_9BASI|nr:hypothetical protein [Austropuccinia psidii MF-1]
MLADKHTRNACLLFDPSDHPARGVPTQDALTRTPFWFTMMKVFRSGNGPRDPKQANGNNSGQLALSHHPMVTSLLDRSEVIIWLMKDGDGKRTFELGPIVTMSCPPWDSNAKNKTQQDSPVQCMPCEQTLWQPTPGPSGTQWSEDLFRKPSQHNETPIPGPSPSSEPPEDVLTHEPEPEVAPTPSMEEPFGESHLHFFNSSQLFLTPPLPIFHSVIIIDNTPVGSPTPPPSTPSQDHPPIAAKNATASSPRCQAPLIPMMMLPRNSPTCDQH